MSVAPKIPLMSEIKWHGELDSDHCGYCAPGDVPHCIKHGITCPLLYADDYDGK